MMFNRDFKYCEPYVNLEIINQYVGNICEKTTYILSFVNCVRVGVR